MMPKSLTRLLKMPAQKASPAPVVSTTCTLIPLTLPLNLCMYTIEESVFQVSYQVNGPRTKHLELYLS